jgi:hypothetical protein
MDAKLPPMKSDVVMVTSEARPTPTPVRTSFSEVLAAGAGSVVGGAEGAMTSLPGTSTMALALRGGAGGAAGAMASPMAGLGGIGGLPMMSAAGGLAEGPGATPGTSFGSQFVASAAAASGGAISGDGSASASLQQSQQSNLYYLQLQQAVNQQSQTFEALSNVMKSESDTVKNAIGNMH